MCTYMICITYYISYTRYRCPKISSFSPQELQAIRRALETAVSAATVAEAQEAMAVNEAREANGRMRVAKRLGGPRGPRGNGGRFPLGNRGKR